jgi:hypothetical protein
MNRLKYASPREVISRLVHLVAPGAHPVRATGHDLVIQIGREHRGPDIKVVPLADDMSLEFDHGKFWKTLVFPIVGGQDTSRIGKRSGAFLAKVRHVCGFGGV